MNETWFHEQFPSNQTPEQALRGLLDSHLRFGDVSQCEALRILRKAETLIGSERTCYECDGAGTVDGYREGMCDNCGRECQYCAYHSEEEECEVCEGTGYIEWDRTLVYKLPIHNICEHLERLGAIAA